VRWRIGLLAGALAITLGPRPARADDKTACIDADTEGQELRLQGQWRKAKMRFQTCVSLQCPAAVLQDCTARYDDIRASIPTLLVAAQQPNGTDTVDARLVIDGDVVSSSLPTTAIEADPGEHVVRIEHDGWTAPEQRVVVREGEKDRRVAFRFAGPAPAPLPARSEGADVLGLTLTAAGGLAVAIGATFVVAGLVRRTDLVQSQCATARTCSPDDVGAIDRDYAIGGIAAGVGVVALGIGIGRLVSHGERSRAGVGAYGVSVSF
jgi:hypothetical protein